MEVIAVKELSKLYSSRDGSVHALQEISFKVSEGEFIAVVGPSGCGKSTLLKILAGILPPSNGEVRLRGTPIRQHQRNPQWHGYYIHLYAGGRINRTSNWCHRLQSS